MGLLHNFCKAVSIAHQDCAKVCANFLQELCILARGVYFAILQFLGFVTTEEPVQ